MSTRPYFRYSLAATAWIAGFPGAVLFIAFAIVQPSPPAVVSAGIAIAAFLVASAIGAWGWARFHASARLTFPELMIWAWAKRSWAERSLARGASLLGGEGGGFSSMTPGSTLSAQRQLRALRRLNTALERKDPYTHGHSSRVERYCTRIAADLGLDQDRISKLRRAAVLHDIGKMRVPERILRKAGPLTPDERAVVEEHVVLGARLVSRLGSVEVVDAVLHHHERWDGRGYPYGLAGERIPLYARIIAVVDAYDAMTSTRPYRAGLSSTRAIEVLWEEAGCQFDAEVVGAFIRTTQARSPVAALVPFVIWLNYLVRETSRLIRQPATVGAAPAAGGMAALALVAGALMSVGGPATTGPHATRQATTPQTSGPIAATSKPEKPAIEDADEPLRKHERSRSGHEGPPGDAASGVAVAPLAKSEHAGEGDPTITTRPATERGAAGAITAPTFEPAGERGGTSEGDGGGGPRGDPRPDHGRDCANPGNPDSKGRAIHCG